VEWVPEQVDAEIVFSALDSGVAGTIEGAFAAAGRMVLSNAKNYRMDADFNFNAFGKHRVRAGFDYELLNAENVSQYSGGVYYRYYQAGASGANFTGGSVAPNTEYVRVRTLFSGGSFDSKNTAFYVQDSWDVTDRINLSLGVRNDRFTNYNANGVKFTDLKNQWAPRLGFTYDVTGDRSSKLFGFWGKYYLPVAVNTNQRLAGAEFFISDTWSLNQTGGPNDLNADGINDTTDEPILGSLLATSTLADGSVKPISTQVDKELDPMFVDEFILG